MKIVDIIPQSMSGESSQDVGCSIAVNPNNPNEIVIATYTADPNGGPNAPVFVSTDGGNTWTLKDIIPGASVTNGTVKFGGTTNELYAGILKAPGPNSGAVDLAILRTTNPPAGTVMTQLDSGGEVEQPYVAAITVPSGPDAGKDRLYIGINDLTNTTPWSSGLTSTIRQTMDAGSAAPVFNSILLDRRAKTPGALQDLSGPRNGPQVRPAVHKDGTVYAAFYSWKTWFDLGNGTGNLTTDIVITRDDNWGQSADPYGSLLDSGDNQAGQRIAINVPLQYLGTIGSQPTAGDLAIAVDPKNSSIVYVAWLEWQDVLSDPSQSVYWLQLRRSTDRGKTWSMTGMAAIANAKSPALAINDKGEVGVMYQLLTGTGNNQRWETHLAFSADSFSWSDTLLATTPAGNLLPFPLYFGDYTSMMAVGDNFYGVFCALNAPSSQYWPQEPQYQRNHNYVSLFDVNGLTPVAPSIDPFFFTTAFIPPKAQMPTRNNVAAVLIILFGIIQDGGGAGIDGQGNVHIVGPGDPGPAWDYLVSLAEYRLATATNTKAGLEMQKLALQNILNLASAQIARLNAQLG